MLLFDNYRILFGLHQLSTNPNYTTIFLEFLNKQVPNSVHAELKLKIACMTYDSAWFSTFPKNKCGLIKIELQEEKLYLQTSNSRTVMTYFLWNSSDLGPIKSDRLQLFSSIQVWKLRHSPSFRNVEFL